MEDILFLKIFVLSIINILSFLLSIYFLVSLYFTKILDFYFIIKEKTVFSQYYKDISVSFSFQTIAFLTFNVSLFVMIYKRDLTSLYKNDNYSEDDKFNFYNMKIFLISFLVCQSFYLLNLILISIGSAKIKGLSLECNLSRDKFIINVYKNILTVGYIFFVIFLVVGIWAFIFAKERFNFFSKLNINNCNCFERYFNEKIENSPGKIKEKKEKIQKEIDELECYINNIKNDIYNKSSIDYNKKRTVDLEYNNTGSYSEDKLSFEIKEET